ncbi:MAG TPA: CDP-archaeol synthase [Candidatus Saccharimonadales bacterium]|nr:CDP-archaeol synthase [Candidatus Saccharimonadales bacterium]
MNSLWSDIFWAFWFFLPAGVANMTPPIANKIPLLAKWNTPMDFGRSFRGKRIFGDNKRWRGLVFGTLMAGLVGGFEYSYLVALDAGHLIATFVLLGILMGLGALTGDAIASFFKRQLKIDSGKSWFPFDQTDYIIGGILFSYPVFHYTVRQMVLILSIYFGLHLLIAYIGYLLKFKDRPI